MLDEPADTDEDGPSDLTDEANRLSEDEAAVLATLEAPLDDPTWHPASIEVAAKRLLLWPRLHTQRVRRLCRRYLRRCSKRSTCTIGTLGRQSPSPQFGTRPRRRAMLVTILRTPRTGKRTMVPRTMRWSASAFSLGTSMASAAPSPRRSSSKTPCERLTLRSYRRSAAKETVTHTHL